jgi:hypothetical protein
MSNDLGSTTILPALPQLGVPLRQRIIAVALYSKLPSAAAVACMLTLAVIEWSRIFAGQGPRLNVYLAIVAIAAVLAGGRVLRAIIDSNVDRAH